MNLRALEKEIENSERLISELDGKHITEYITDRIIESKFEIIERVNYIENLVREIVLSQED